MTNLEKVNNFITENKSKFILNFLDTSKEDIISICLNFLHNESDCENLNDLLKVLEAIRILSREKSLEMKSKLCTEELWKTLIKLSCYEEYSNQKDKIAVLVNKNANVIEESLKALCNLTKQYSETIPKSLSEVAVKGAFKRLELYDINMDEITASIKSFEIRFLFLITAVIPELRFYAIDECSGFTVFIDLFQGHLNKSIANKLTAEDIELDVELTKLLFNLLYISGSSSFNQDMERKINKIVTILRDFYMNLRVKDEISESLKLELLNNIINLMSALPNTSFEYFLFDDDQLDKNNLFESEKAMEFYGCALKYFDSKISDPNISSEVITPFLHGFSRACNLNRNIRKFMRLQILPYLKQEVIDLPEQGNTMRNKLCKLLQNVSETISEAVALFLFVLCKQSVDRAIKYTGFGNFAGFLARHSLLNACSNGKENQEYSESDESETEEYSNVKHQINPVTGRVENDKDRVNPMDEMSEEQKEYEVVKLMNEIDKLQRVGIIQPGVVSEDGSVRPAESILEIMERSGNQNRDKDNSNED